MITGLPLRPAPVLASQTTSPPIRRPLTVPSEDSAAAAWQAERLRFRVELPVSAAAGQ